VNPEKKIELTNWGQTNCRNIWFKYPLKPIEELKIDVNALKKQT
jgi:hypothetical protein